MKKYFLGKQKERKYVKIIFTPKKHIFPEKKYVSLLLVGSLPKMPPQTLGAVSK
jgi:hypothetical protein